MLLLWLAVWASSKKGKEAVHDYNEGKKYDRNETNGIDVSLHLVVGPVLQVPDVLIRLLPSTIKS